MCSINHDLKAIFIHIHKTGGSYVASVLKRFYGFETYYLKRPDHDIFCLNRFKNPNQKNYENRVHGVYMYYKTSPQLNAKMGMTPQKWDSYYKFTFIRNPYDRMVSGWNHMKKSSKIPLPFDRYVTMKSMVSDMEYIHTFMNQAQHIWNERRQLVVNFIGHFERLEEDLDKVLTHLGIYYRIHNPYQRINSHAHLHYSAYFNQGALDVVNGLIAEDLKYFGSSEYPVFRTMEEMLQAVAEEEKAKSKEMSKQEEIDVSSALIYHTNNDLGDSNNDLGDSNNDLGDSNNDLGDLGDSGNLNDINTRMDAAMELQKEPDRSSKSITPLSGMILMDQALEEIIRSL